MVMFTEVEGQKIIKSHGLDEEDKNFKHPTRYLFSKRWSCCELPGEKSLLMPPITSPTR